MKLKNVFLIFAFVMFISCLAWVNADDVSAASGTVYTEDYEDEFQWHYSSGTLRITGIDGMSEWDDEDWDDEDWDDEDWGDEGSGDGKVVLNEYVLSEIEEGLPYSANVQTVELCGDITAIGKEAFRYTYDIRELERLTIKSPVQSIGSRAFYNCSKLRYITFSGSIKQIGSRAFYGTDVRKVVLPDSSGVVKDRAFSNCKKLKDIYAPAGWSSDNDNIVSLNKDEEYVDLYCGDAKDDSYICTDCFRRTYYEVPSVSEFETMRHDISKYKCTMASSIAYTGEKRMPSVTINNRGTILKKGKDYSISYNNNIRIGTATAIITGIGDYNGEKVKTFKIVKGIPKIQAKNKIKSMHAKKYRFKLNAKTNSNAKLKYKSNNKNIRVNYKGIITVKKNYYGKAKITLSTKETGIYRAKKKTITVRIKKPKIKVKKTIKKPMHFKTYRFNVKAKTIKTVKLKYKSNNKNVRVNSKGRITVKKNYYGKAKITVSIKVASGCKAIKKKVRIYIKKPRFELKKGYLYRGVRARPPHIYYATKKPRHWESTNTSVATVSKKGTIHAKEPGSCYIKCKVGTIPLKFKLVVERRNPNFGAVLRTYNTRNNYFKVKYKNNGAKTLYIQSGIKVRDNDYKDYDRYIYLKKPVKIRSGKTKYVKFYVKGSNTWPDVGDFTLYYYFKYDGKKHEGHVWDCDSVYHDKGSWWKTYWTTYEDWYYYWY